MSLMGEPTPSVSYYDNGIVRNKGFLLDGEMHGEWEFLRKDGSLMRTGAFDRGRQIGTWRTFDRKGQIVKETQF
jgi:antitoxin component YwqK of YwqJK toxin-antitoxin module